MNETYHVFKWYAGINLGVITNVFQLLSSFYMWKLKENIKQREAQSHNKSLGKRDLHWNLFVVVQAIWSTSTSWAILRSLIHKKCTLKIEHKQFATDSLNQLQLSLYSLAGFQVCLGQTCEEGLQPHEMIE